MLTGISHREASQDGEDAQGGKDEDLVFLFGFGMSEETSLLLGLWPKTKVRRLHLSFFDLSGFHSHI